MAVPVISIEQMREWETAAWAAGKTEQEVIKRVGQAVAATALSLTGAKDRVLILAGKGHNGDDARAAREHLAGRQVELLEASDPVAAAAGLEAALNPPPDLVIDGLFGIGLNRSLSDEWIHFIERVNSGGCTVLAVDVPSGLDADTGQHFGAAIQAAVTLTVGAPKRGLLRESAWPFVGRLEVAAEVGLGDCPLRSEIQWTLPADFRGFPPRRAVGTHKGSYGHLAIVAGSRGFHGAAVLAAQAAQRAQPGLITLHAPESVYPVIAPQFQAVMVTPWALDTKLPGPWSAVLVGPGLAAPELPDQIKLLTRLLWRDSALPVVIDASALDWLPLDVTPRDAVRVLTPHPGEAARLLRTTTERVQADRVAAVREISRRYANAWVVLKGHQTLVGRSSGEIYVNGSGNPHLAQGGSGDVLSGYIAGLLAQPGLRQDVCRVLRFAVWQHGAAADRLQRQRANWTVEDLLRELGNVPAESGG
ncbi:MAG TPA: NAD(P)H-hydrate dehydratase [Candidatus Paceibacterota bacterium]|jgi:hydroxyethylthiazole kinase-like uncharacterized protein yjeF|nr:NAD(P)H-hydrate dehydratase [Candidatus Paceibacterota bacterium]